MNKIVCIKGTFGQFTFGQQQDGGENTNMKKNENVMDQFRPKTRCFNNFSLNKKITKIRQSFYRGNLTKTFISNGNVFK